MTDQILVTLVNSVLGVGRPTARNNYAYKCPFCHHQKTKLEVNLTKNKEGVHKWHCWSCDTRGKTLYSLFKKLKVPQNKLSEVKKIAGNYIPSFTKTNEEPPTITLPKEFKKLENIPKSDIDGKHALYYLKNRGLSIYDILKYNIGYCNSGPYKDTVIIPIYNANYELIYFVSKNFKLENGWYKMPPFSKNFIPNEHLINWDLPLVLCEGIFDAITIKRNAIPLLGKTIPQNLMKKIIKSTVEKIYIALDGDAKKQSFEFCEKLLNENKEVYLLNIQDKDPNDLGFEKFTSLIQKTYPIDYFTLMKMKLYDK